VRRRGLISALTAPASGRPVEDKTVHASLGLGLRIGALAILALAGAALAGCDTLARHGRAADGCDCYSSVYRDTPPMIGHSWKI